MDKRQLKMTPERIQAIQNLRRSNAATPHKNKKAYNRKAKYGQLS